MTVPADAEALALRLATLLEDATEVEEWPVEVHLVAPRRILLRYPNARFELVVVKKRESPEYLTSIIDGRVMHLRHPEGGPWCGQRGRLSLVTEEHRLRRQYLRARPVCGRCTHKQEEAADGR